MAEKIVTHYMIRDKNTGLFSPGGSDADKFGRTWKPAGKGKVWTSMGALKNHLRQYQHPIYSVVRPYQRVGMSDVPESWEVLSVEIRIVETPGTETISARSLVPIKEK